MSENQTVLIKQRVAQVRAQMREHNVSVYMVFTGDYHLSEYAGDYFAEREFLSGFTGSAGTLVLTQSAAALFTDGRYFVQAKAQLAGTDIVLMKMGVAGVPSISDFVRRHIQKGTALALDGRTCDLQSGLELKKITEEKEADFLTDVDFIAALWEDRPLFPNSNVYELPLQYCGETRKKKMEKVRKKMKLEGVEVHIISSLDDICWLYNLRGDDIPCNPVFMAYTVLTQETAVLYTQKTRFTEKLYTVLQADGIQIQPYEAMYSDLSKLHDVRVWLDAKRTNVRIYEILSNQTEIIQKENATVYFKAVKNDTELENLRNIHVQDGLCVTKFMFWLKKQMADGNPEKITEYQAAMYLDNLRSQVEHYKDLSFDTISAYNANAAMMHYHAEENNSALLCPEGMLLVDSGGQYLEGTTDITRTFALGNVTDEMKKYFTLTLKGMLALTHAHFLQGCTGFNLDILARAPLWNVGMDYRCGTGHGIGYMLNVHEAPNGFRWKHVVGKNDLCVLEPGMVTSNEPGVYVEGAYGIRIENEIVCVKDYENEYGTFLKFDTLTAVPIDLDLVDETYLDDTDRARLNDYHAWVYDRLAPLLSGEELTFLRKYTRKV